MAEETGAPAPGPETTPSEDLSFDEIDDILGEQEEEIVEEPVETPASNNLSAELEAEIAELRQKAQIVDAFQADPKGVLTQLAERIGLTVSEGGGKPDPAPSGSTTPSAAEKLKATLSKHGLEFLAEPLAEALPGLLESETAPVKHTVEEMQRQQRQREMELAQEQLSQTNPDWRQHEPAMVERMNFLREALNGGPQNHPKFGSLVANLLQLETGGANSARRVLNRFATADNNRVSSSTGGRTQVNVDDQIDKAKTLQDKFAIALRSAIPEVGG